MLGVAVVITRPGRQKNLATPLSEDGQEEGAKQNICEGRRTMRLDRTL